MAKFHHHQEPFEIQHEVDVIRFDCNGPCPVESWREQCVCGVEHRYSTATRSDYDSGEPYAIPVRSHHQCFSCGTWVVPSMMRMPHVHSEPGMESATLRAWRWIGTLYHEYTVHLNADQWHRLKVVHPEDREEVVWDIVDTALVDGGVYHEVTASSSGRH
jgi:hypothetical protein